MLGQTCLHSRRVRFVTHAVPLSSVAYALPAVATLLLSLVFWSSAALAQASVQADDAESSDVPGTVVARESRSGAITVDALLLRRNLLQDVPFTKLGDAPPTATEVWIVHVFGPRRRELCSGFARDRKWENL